VGVRDRLNLEDRIQHFATMFTKEMMDKMLGTKDYNEVENFKQQGENILRLLSTEKILENMI
jgi:hypothetical protein